MDLFSDVMKAVQILVRKCALEEFGISADRQRWQVPGSAPIAFPLGLG